jgi:hypothetical protein
MSSGVDAFLKGFALPLVRGGEMHVGAPVDQAKVEAWSARLAEASGTINLIDAEREAVAAELVVRPPPMAFGGFELRIAAALYDVLALAHPAASSVTARDRAKRHVLETALALADVPPPQTRGDLLERHGLLHNLLDVSRQDTRVSWWTGKAEFRGQKPPARLTRWGSVRRVRVQHETVAIDELLESDEASAVAGRLLRASPLTDLLAPARARPAFAWEGCGQVLRDAELARVVAYRWLGDASELTAAAAAGGRAWEKLLHGGASADVVRVVTAFLVHLLALLALDEVRERDLDAPSQAIKAAIDSRDPGSLALLAVPEVAASVDPRLAEPPGLADDAPLARRWRAHRAQARGTVAERVGELAEKLRARLGSVSHAGAGG